MNPTLDSEDDYRQAYRQKLVQMLQAASSDPDYGLAAFILACANSFFDGLLLADLRNVLADTFGRLHKQYAQLLAQGRILDERHAEDLLVFLKIGLVGFDHLKVTEHRQAAWWQVQFNQIRSFRPQRTAARPVASIHQAFNEFGFHYDQELCAREGFWEGRLGSKQAFFLYNKYPFARLHALLVPEPELLHPQYLNYSHHAWAHQVTQSLASALPGFGLGYNSLGTFASVNHLHFQSFIEPRGMPVTWDIWQHNGGTKMYPTACIAFDSLNESWDWIEAIHHMDKTAYNLLYTPERIYGFERKRQGTYKHAAWTSGFAWFEVSGNLIVFSQEDFQSITFEKIEKEFTKLAV